MAIYQIYETTIIHHDFQLGARIMSVPIRSFSDKDILRNNELILKYLEFEFLKELTELNDPISVFSNFFKYDSFLQDRDGVIGGIDSKLVKLVQNGEENHQHFSFSTYLFSEKIVPIEQSPLSAESFIKIFKSLGGVGLGAFVGFVAAGNTPMLFLSVPAGMLLCGTVAGISKALEDGLREKIYKLITKEKKKKKVK